MLGTDRVIQVWVGFWFTFHFRGDKGSFFWFQVLLFISWGRQVSNLLSGFAFVFHSIQDREGRSQKKMFYFFILSRMEGMRGDKFFHFFCFCSLFHFILDGREGGRQVFSFFCFCSLFISSRMEGEAALQLFNIIL